MKKIFGLIFLSTVLLCLSALAQSPVPAPSASPVPVQSVGELLLGLLALIKSWKSLGLAAALIALLKFLVDAIKVFGIWDKIPEALRGLAVLGVSALTVGLTAMASGASLPQAVSAVLGSAAGSMFFHELLKDLLEWYKSKKSA